MAFAQSESQRIEDNPQRYQMEVFDSSAENWRPGRKEYLIVLLLTVLSLVVALDTTILVSVLSVCRQSHILSSVLSTGDGDALGTTMLIPYFVHLNRQLHSISTEAPRTPSGPDRPISLRVRYSSPSSSPCQTTSVVAHYFSFP